MLSGGALLLDAHSIGARHSDSGTAASSSFPLARACPVSTETLLSVPLGSMAVPVAHLGFPAFQRDSAQSGLGLVLAHAGSQTAAPNQAVELTPSARHAGCCLADSAAAVTPRSGGSSPWGR